MERAMDLAAVYVYRNGLGGGGGVTATGGEGTRVRGHAGGDSEKQRLAHIHDKRTGDSEAVYERVFICLSWRKFTIALLFLSSLPTIRPFTPHPQPPPLPPPDTSLTRDSGNCTSTGTKRTLLNTPPQLLSSAASLFLSFIPSSIPSSAVTLFLRVGLYCSSFPMCSAALRSIFTPGQTLKDQ